MGMDQTVSFSGPPPSWEAVRDLLTQHGYAVQMRMIDGQLAFPDEAPPEGWRELRVGTPGGMVTVRRESGQMVLVVWGNADAGLRQAWNALAWAAAEAGGGQVRTAEGAFGAADYRRQADLPESLRAGPPAGPGKERLS
jgi:hypothetical protein